jgi:hypothetical protein
MKRNYPKHCDTSYNCKVCYYRDKCEIHSLSNWIDANNQLAKFMLEDHQPDIQKLLDELQSPSRVCQSVYLLGFYNGITYKPTPIPTAFVDSTSDNVADQ